MKISIIDRQILFGVCYKDRGAITYEVTEEEGRLLQMGLAVLNHETGEVTLLEQPEPELPEIDKSESLVTISVPAQIAMQPAVKEKIETICYFYSTIRRYLQDGYLVLSNIVLKDVSSFMSDQEYQQFKALGVVFDPLICEEFGDECGDNAEGRMQSAEDIIAPSDDDF